MIQLKWSNETNWKDYEPDDSKLEFLKEDWIKTKAKYNLKYDAELRIVQPTEQKPFAERFKNEGS